MRGGPVVHAARATALTFPSRLGWHREKREAQA